MQSLIDKIRTAREQIVEAGKYKFTIRRPTHMDIVNASQLRQSDVLKQFVVDWSGVTELDIIAGGTGDEIPFDSDLFVEWIADKPSLWSPITDVITQSYQKHLKEIGEVEKKSPAG